MAKFDAPEITVEELKQKLDRKEDIFLLDVREQFEYDIARLENARLIPLGQLPDRVSELEPFKDREIAVYCKAGGRSGRAVQLLRGRGFLGAVNVAGGIDAWSERIDPTVASY
ncbi:MAG: rhodanese-like domain-containing protein [Elusimicrobia bacterium]|nr:rhodanese-like domain-containing protein [Elusimicrobiota bacterium]